jgi:hypothetical protein
MIRRIRFIVYRYQKILYISRVNILLRKPENWAHRGTLPISALLVNDVQVRGGFTVQNVPKIINSRRSPIKKQPPAVQSADAASRNGAKFKENGAKFHKNNHVEEEEEEARPMVNDAPAKFCGMLQATSARHHQVPVPSGFNFGGFFALQ